RVTEAFNAGLNKQMQMRERSRLPFSWNTFEPNLFKEGAGALIKLVERDAAKMRRDFSVDLVAVLYRYDGTGRLLRKRRQGCPGAQGCQRIEPTERRNGRTGYRGGPLRQGSGSRTPRQ